MSNIPITTTHKNTVDSRLRENGTLDILHLADSIQKCTFSHYDYGTPYIWMSRMYIEEENR